MAQDQIVRGGEREQFVTLDGSLVTELVHPRHGDSQRQSVAEAVVPGGGATFEHLHRESEEIYAFIAGSGWMTLGERRFAVAAGDAVVIAPGTPHKLWSEAGADLVLLCVSSPPYSDRDTVLLEGAQAERSSAADGQ